MKGKRAVLVGAASGIGLATARLFASEGARLVIADVNDAGGRAAAQDVDGRFEPCDVSDEASVRTMVARAAETLGGLDVVVNNAGMLASGTVAEFDAATWDRLFEINVRGVFLVCKYAVPHLKQSAGASIVNTSSLAGVRGGGGVAAYSATKGAIIAFTTALALELAPHVRVNAVCPGWVDTPFNEPAIAAMGGRDAQARMIAASVPMGRQATPEEIAPLYAYLASDESAFMTAQSMLIDGGVHN